MPRSPEERLETALHPWVGFVVVPILALANAGVVVCGADFRQPVVMAVIAGLVLTWLTSQRRAG